MAEPDYRQSAIAGQKWRRSLHIECNNGYGQTPSIRFDEEDRYLMADGSSVGVPAGSVSKDFVDPGIEFPLLNPENGGEIGQTVTYGFVYMVLWSVYIHLAKERDAGAGEEAP